MINKTINILLVILFFLLPLINSHLIDLFGIKWGFYVDGNYEFTKVIFFNIFSGLIITLFFIKNYLEDNNTKIPKIILFLIGIILLSNIFSSHFFTSLLGNTSKGHSSLMFLNLIGLFLVFIKIDKRVLNKLILTTLISAVIIGLISIKEYFIPTFDYGNLSNRAIGTFGHPNYLALFILIIIPFILNNIKNKIYLFLFILLFITLFLTKSAWGIFIFLLYLFISFIRKKNIGKKIKKKYLLLFLIFLFIFSTIIILKYFPEKLQSFLSRFYIWWTTKIIILSDLKNIIFGGGLGTLGFIFDGYKLKELYIYENIGFTADRPHNLILNYFYNFGILGFIFIIYLINNLINNYKNIPLYHSLILFLIFTIFNYPSISHYLIIILIISSLYIKKNNYLFKSIIINKTIIILLITTSLLGSYLSINYYINENKKKVNLNHISYNYFIKEIENEDYIYNLFKNGLGNIEYNCGELTNYQNSVENNFYCGNIIWNTDKKLSIEYYKKGLNKLPDMRNSESKYYNSYLIKKLFTPERFYAKKFSNLEEILKRVGKK